MALGTRFRRSPPRPTLVVDEPTGPVTIDGGTLVLTGWAIDGARCDPGWVRVVVGDTSHPVRRVPRSDVARHLELDTDVATGFTAAIDRRLLPPRGDASVVATFGDGTTATGPTFGFTHAAAEPVPTEPVLACPICATRQRRVSGSSDGLRMARCGDCGVVYTIDRPTAGFLAARYSPEYFEGEYLPALDAEAEAMTTHWSQLLDMVEPHRGADGRLFEIGTGAGRFLAAARERGWTVAGADVNAAAVDHGRRVLGLDLRAAPGDAPISPPGSFDVVVSEMSLEHVPDPVAVMHQAAAALRSGGVVLLFTVCADGRSFTDRGMASPLVGPAEHLFLFSEDSLRRLAVDAGLEPLLCWTDEPGDSIGLIARRA